MPASPIVKDITLPDNWVHLQKTMIPDSNTSCYWSVWYDIDDESTGNMSQILKGTAWLMCCYIDDNPSINDSWYHVEDMEEVHRNVLTAIEAVYGVDFKDSIWFPMTAVEGKIIIPSE